jgi:hypothetical protein
MKNQVRFLLATPPPPLVVVDEDFNSDESEDNDVWEDVLSEDGVGLREEVDSSLKFEEITQEVAKNLLEWYLSEKRLRQVARTTFLMTHQLIDSDSFCKEAGNHLSCPICREVFVNAMICRYCGRSYCRPCLYVWLGRNNHCPTCNNTVVNRNDFIPNRELRNIANEYRLLSKLPLTEDLTTDPDLAVPPPPPLPQIGAGAAVNRRFRVEINEIRDVLPPRTWKEFFIISAIGSIPVIGPTINGVNHLVRGNYVLSILNFLFIYPDLYFLASFSSFFNFCESLDRRLLLEDSSWLVKLTLDNIKEQGVMLSDREPAMAIAKEAIEIAFQRVAYLVEFIEVDHLVSYFYYALGAKVVQVGQFLRYFRYINNNPAVVIDQNPVDNNNNGNIQ